jgi:hypothetical protein
MCESLEGVSTRATLQYAGSDIPGWLLGAGAFGNGAGALYGPAGTYSIFVIEESGSDSDLSLSHGLCAAAEAAKKTMRGRIHNFCIFLVLLELEMPRV